MKDFHVMVAQILSLFHTSYCMTEEELEYKAGVLWTTYGAFLVFFFCIFWNLTAPGYY